MRNQIKLSFLSWFILIFMLAAQTVAYAGETLSSVSVPVIFSDVSKGEPNWLFINYLTNRGLVKGYADGTFSPRANLTRAEAVTLLIRASGISNKVIQSPFKDVNSNYWAAGNITAAVEAGIVKGYPDGTFRPSALLTRAEGIALLLRISKQADANIILPVLQDLSSQHWAAGPIAIGLASEMVSLSKDNQQFLPNVPLTRSEMTRALAVLLTKDPDLAQTPLNNDAQVLAGTAEITRAGTSFEVTGGFIVQDGDTIKTAANSAVEVSFSDGTGLQIKENTELKIKETKGRAYIKADGTKGTAVEWLALELNRGRIFGALATPAEATPTQAMAALKEHMVTVLKSIIAIENKPALFTTMAAKPASPWWKYNKTKRVKVQVDMPWGVAAIRGTFWENAVYLDGRSKTTLLIGEGELTSGGQTVALKANEKTEINAPNAAPIPPTPMTSEESKEWVAAKEWVMERAQDIQVNQEKALPPAAPAVVQAPTTPVPITPVEEEQAPGTTLPDLIGKAIGDAEKSASTSVSSGGGGSSTVAVTGVTLNPSNLTLNIGNTATLTATVAPANATNKNVTWSSNSSVVEVTNGVLSAVGSGTATITVTSQNGGFVATCNVTVPVPVTGVTLNKTSLSIAKAGGVIIDLTEAVVPANATNKAVIWISSNPSFVTVDTSGVLTPVAPGTATITVTTADGGKTATCSVTVSPLALQAAVPYTTGDGPIGAVLGNVNGDIYDDIIVTNSGSDNAYILFGDTNYTYPTSEVLETGASPRKLVQGSFNGSGFDDDLAIARVTANDIHVMLSNGDGTFQTGTSYPLGAVPRSLNTGDLNNDNITDLVVGRNDDIYVLLNSGSGNGEFTEFRTHFVGATPYRIAVGNFTTEPYDEYIDLAVARTVSNDVYILKGLGGGQFIGGQVIPLGFAPTSMIVSDFNSDLKYDLAVTRSGANDVYILFGNGDGTFGSGASYSLGSTPGSIAFGDFNRDYIKDLIVTSYDGTEGTVAILLGNGTMGSPDGTFQAPVSFPVGKDPGSVIVREESMKVNLVVVVNKDSDNISILLNDTPSEL